MQIGCAIGTSWPRPQGKAPVPLVPVQDSPSPGSSITEPLPHTPLRPPSNRTTPAPAQATHCRSSISHATAASRDNGPAIAVRGSAALPGRGTLGTNIARVSQQSTGPAQLPRNTRGPAICDHLHGAVTPPARPVPPMSASEPRKLPGGVVAQICRDSVARPGMVLPATGIRGMGTIRPRP